MSHLGDDLVDRGVAGGAGDWSMFLAWALVTERPFPEVGLELVWWG